MLNFQHLRKKMLERDTSGANNDTGVSSGAVIHGNDDGHQDAQSPSVVNGNDDGRSISVLAWNRQDQFGPGDSITQTGYCIGCLRSSVDMPGTEHETWYCRRNQDKEGVIVFKRISPGVVVRQCRYRVEG